MSARAAAGIVNSGTISVGGVNDYHTTRQLAPTGLTGFATTSPIGESYNAYGEAGYRLVHAGYTITPYLGAGYVHDQWATRTATSRGSNR
ncbi:MAG TPA: autotransporter domain-containing protein [Stellaceae bacterium]|nr:autotransporter domain-containing protein [Stellaceae bacterium]